MSANVIPADHDKSAPGSTAGNPTARGPWRAPTRSDYLNFFVLIPAGIAFMFSLVGIRLINGMPYLDGLIYMTLHMFLAWWAVSLGAGFVKFIFRSWKPPAIAVCIMGYLLATIPAAFGFQALGDFFADIYPSFAANRMDTALPSWGSAYLLHFVRYSIPALPLFLAGALLYRRLTHVNWYGYNRDEKTATTAPVVPQPQAIDTVAPTSTHKAVMAIIGESKLPADAEILAIKAEQHYIQIWSDQGMDLIRYRFKDLSQALAGCNGSQVHRSWWINFDQVTKATNTGRKIELHINDELVIPVSHAYKNAVLDRLKDVTIETTVAL